MPGNAPYQGAYLAADTVIDWQEEAVLRLAQGLAAHHVNTTARRCYAFVRDAIAHSLDIGAATLTCSASEVLREGHGYCYAKAHLLAALLRANGIPAGFDYQRLGDGAGGYVLHGITTVYLHQHGWYRIDARGNKPGIDAQFALPQQQLAWCGAGSGEVNYRLNLAAPYPAVVAALSRPLTVQQLLGELPERIEREGE